VCLRLECSAMGAPDGRVYIKNVVPWEAQTGVYTLRMLCHGQPRLVCLR